MKTKVTPTVIESAIEDFKTSLLRDAINDAPHLTQCYSNWFRQNINHEQRVLDLQTDTPPHVLDSVGMTISAWQRARDLFFTLAFPTLQGLANTVASQIEIEFQEGIIADADVPDNLRNLTFAELLQHLD